MTKKSIKTLSLFSGAGGLDLGFHKAGFNIVSCVEVESTFCQTLQFNKKQYFPNAEIFNTDIRHLDPKSITSKKIDFVIGGPPCQSFSAAGRRAGGVVGTGDERGSLFEHYCRFIHYFKPKGFLFENVRGILSANKRDDWHAILNTFKDLGYHISFRVLDAADYGVPQHRERLILVGVQQGSEYLFPRPTFGSDSKNKISHISCGTSIHDLQPKNEPVHDYGGKYGKLLKQIPPGSNYLFFTKEFGHPNPIFAWRSRFSDFLHKAHPDQPVRTIVARMGAFSGPLHWKNRKFTIDELKRLFTFPDKYNITGGQEMILKQLGNSVPPDFAHHLALSIRQQIFNESNLIDVISSNTVLSFDKRKKEKAHRTRLERAKHESNTKKLMFSKTSKVLEKRKISNAEKYFCLYSGWKKQKISKKPFHQKGKHFKISIITENGKCQITVKRITDGVLSKNKLLQYRMDFEKIIGSGIISIKCNLFSDCDEDVVASWDAIESYLTKHSNYFSLMDIFGHFTEPHPIFSLKMNILGKKTPLLLFAEYFSDFTKISIDFPEKLLKTFHNSFKNYNFLNEIKKLRALRFDVRTNETNVTIKPGYFRCCYPFTLHIDKQNAIAWRENPSKTNSLLRSEINV